MSFCSRDEYYVKSGEGSNLILIKLKHPETKQRQINQAAMKTLWKHMDLIHQVRVTRHRWRQ